MTEPNQDLEEQNGEFLPDREAMSIVSPPEDIAPVVEPEHPEHDLPLEEPELP